MSGLSMLARKRKRDRSAVTRNFQDEIHVNAVL